MVDSHGKTGKPVVETCGMMLVRAGVVKAGGSRVRDGDFPVEAGRGLLEALHERSQMRQWLEAELPVPKCSGGRKNEIGWLRDWS